MKCTVGLIAAVVCVGLAGPAGAVLNGPKDSSTFGFKYECDILPGAAGFTEGALAGSPAMAANGGILSCPAYGWFDGSGLFPVTPSTSYTVEFRSRTLSAAGTYPGFSAMFSNNGTSIGWFSVGTDQVKEAYTQTTITGMNNSDEFHTYRVAYESGAGQYAIWRDGRSLSGVPSPLGLSGDYGKIFQFGNLSTAGLGASEVDYIRWDMSGAYVPENSGMSFPGTKSTWKGYDRYDFSCNGFSTRVVAPAVAVPGNPWVMRGEFEDYHTEVDEALLAQGYHIVFTEGIVQQFGSPTAVGRWNDLYETMTTEYGLAEKAVLEGISRSGLLVHNWAAANPDKVACILGYVPVCDIKSWPAGPVSGGIGVGNTVEWENLKNAYGFASDAEALAYDQNPVDTLATLAGAGIRILHLAGDADIHVPLSENSQVVYDRYRALNGEMELIIVPGGDHGAWIDDVTPIVDFVTVPEPASMALLMVGGWFLQRRGRLE